MFGRCWTVAAVVTLWVAAVCAAQEPESSVNAALVSLTQRASTVFAGEVMAIRHVGGVVEIDFRVDEPLKSVTSSYKLREWSGLWSAGQRRYWIGERAVLFLYAPSSSGLATPVDGMDGVLPLISSSVLAVDIGRLRTRVQRQVGQPMSYVPEMLSFETLRATITAQLPVAPKPVIPVRARPVLPVRGPDTDPEIQMPEMVRRINAPR